MLCLLISPLELIQPREKNLHVLVEYVRFERRLKFPKLVCYHYTTYSILKQTIVNSPSTIATYLISPFWICYSDIAIKLWVRSCLGSSLYPSGASTSTFSAVPYTLLLCMPFTAFNKGFQIICNHSGYHPKHILSR